MSIATPPSGPASLPATRTVTRPSLLRIYMQLTKARLSALVILTTAAGYLLAAPRVEWMTLMWTVLGTALSAGSANALNQIWERRRDQRMHRTRERPLPAGHLSPVHAFTFAVLIGYAGLSMLAMLVNLAAAGLALLTIVLYVLIYTPLKVRTTLNTLIGAVCGAIPPMIGWVAAGDGLAPGAWLLAALLFIWQLPHFMSLAWLYREDYGRGGFVMLPNRDERGELTGLVACAGALLLLLVGVLGVLIGLAGWVFAAGAAIVGLWTLTRSLSFLAGRTDHNARRLFRASLVYLTIVLGLLVIDRGAAVVPGDEALADARAEARFVHATRR